MTRSTAEQARDKEPPGEKAGDPRPESPPGKSTESPPAGPHAKPELTNEGATPGAGLLPDPDEPQDAPDSTSS